MAKSILGPDGRPVDRATLTQEVVAASVGGLRYWGSETIARKLTPARLERILLAAVSEEPDAYLLLAEEIEELDLHYRAQISTRKLAVAGLDVLVEAASTNTEDGRIAEALRKVVAGHEFQGLILDLLDGIAKGYSVCEIIWDRGGALWRPLEYVWRDPRLFRFRADSRDLRLLDAKTPEGIPLPPFKFVVHKPHLKTGLLIRGGLARPAAWGFLAKLFALGGWVQLAEIFGMPLRLGRYPEGVSDADLSVLRAAVINLASDAAAILPDSMRIDFVEGGKSNGNLHLGLVRYLDEQVSKLVLGQTMSADSGSSLAQAQIHNEVRQDIREADAMQLAATLMRDLVRPWVDLNFGARDDYPLLSLPVPEIEDIGGLSDALQKLVPLGLRVGAGVVRKKLGFPDPVDGEELLAPPAPIPAKTSNHSCPSCSARSRNRAGEEAGDEVDALAIAALEGWKPVMELVVNPILGAAGRAVGFDGFLAALPGVVGDMDPRDLALSLATAMFKARGEGNGHGS